jgi:hypothetical protein
VDSSEVKLERREEEQSARKVDLVGSRCRWIGKNDRKMKEKGVILGHFGVRNAYKSTPCLNLAEF